MKVVSRQELAIVAKVFLVKYRSSVSVIDAPTVLVESVKYVEKTVVELWGRGRGLGLVPGFFAALWSVVIYCIYNLCYLTRPKALVHPRVRPVLVSRVHDDVPSNGNYKVIKPPQTKPPPLTTVVSSGAVDMVTKPVVFGNETENVVKCLNERAFADLSPRDQTTCKEFEQWLPNFWMTLFGEIKTFTPTSFTDWVSRFPPAKRAPLMKIHTEMRECTDRDCTLRQCFIKKEITWKEEGCPRLITGVADVFKVLVGPYLHGLSKVVGRKLRNSQFVYAPGLNVLEIGQWPDLTKGGISTDMSRFDSHVTSWHMRLMLSVYKHFNFPNDIIHALEQSINMNCYFRSGLHVVPNEPRRSTGHPNTTVENTLLNIALHAFALSRHNSPKARLIAGGDDVLIQGDVDLSFVETLTALGFDTKPKVCPPGKLEFYSGIFIPSMQGVVLTPKVGRALRKLNWNLTNTANYGSTVLSTKASFSHVPKVLELLDVCYPGVAVMNYKTNYLLPQTPVTYAASSDAALEAYYPGFASLISALKEHFVAGEAFYSPAFQELLEQEE